MQTMQDWPSFGLVADMRPALAAARERGRAVALATLHSSSGGAPRGLGAQMLVGAEAVTGFLSGGCVEADVALRARGVLTGGDPLRLVYGEGGPFDIRLACGGRIDVLLERIAPDDPAIGALLDAAERRVPALLLSDGLRRACLRANETPEVLPAHFARTAALARSSTACAGSGKQLEGIVFRRFAPVQRLVVLGHDPVALALAQLGVLGGMEVFLVRPKGPAAPPPIPGLRAYLRGAPGEALTEIGLDTWTAVAIATHDDFLDQAALLAALPSRAGCVGLLGSARRLPRTRARLKAAGLDAGAVARLKAPIGLPLGGKTPWEIAVSILAEVYATANAAAAAQPASVAAA